MFQGAEKEGKQAMTTTKKHWIEIYHKGQDKPSLVTITDSAPERVRQIIAALDGLELAWAFGSGERMPDQVEWYRPRPGREEGRHPC